MTLSSGTKLGLYEILSPIGAGGMGEVYLACDGTLDRRVAIKVLPETMTRDPERVARFEREAKVLASLNHPNIAAIHGFDDANGTRFLVMEYVEGETLAHRLEGGALAVEDALDIAKQMAETLEAAHEKGVIHRDLKPANVMIREDGTVKVLDFGLAKAMAEEPADSIPTDSPTITANFTRPGVVLGTAAYMSPEQARGRPLDKRTDIWSFGIMLFECLTGQRLFQGETANDSMGAIMHKDPEWSLLPPNMPPTIKLLLRRCLTKDRRRRLHDIADARVELDDAIRDPAGTELDLSATSVAPSRSGAGTGRLIVGVVLGATLSAFGFLGMRIADRRLPVRKFIIPVARVQDLWNTPTSAISPDGNRIAFVEKGRLWIRDLNQLRAHEIPNSDGATSPFWSPDSASVGYFDLPSLAIRTFKSSTRTARTVCPLQRYWSGATATWGEKGTIVFDRADGLYEVESLGGEPRLRIGHPVDTGVMYRHPRFMPGGEDLLAIRQERDGDSRVVRIRGNSVSLLPGLDQSVSYIALAGGSHLLYQRGDLNRGIWALALSPKNDAVPGTPFRVTDTGQHPSAASDGTLLFQSLGMDQLIRVSRSGATIEIIGRPQQQIMQAVLSPDGRHIAASAIENGKRRVWIHDIARHTRVPLSTDVHDNGQPAWSPSGASIFFTSIRRKIGIYRAQVGILGEPTIAVEHQLECAEASVSSDGKYIAFLTIAADDESNPYDIWQRSLADDATSAPLVATPANELLPVISPDGRYVAFMSDQTGRWEIFVASFPDGARVWGPLSTDGGVHPKWSKNGELFYVDDQGLMAVKLSTGAEFAWELPVRLFTEEHARVDLVDLDKVPVNVRYDVDPSGKSFIMVRHLRDSDSGITIVQNWLEEFKTAQ